MTLNGKITAIKKSGTNVTMIALIQSAGKTQKLKVPCFEAPIESSVGDKIKITIEKDN